MQQFISLQIPILEPSFGLYFVKSFLLKCTDALSKLWTQGNESDAIGVKGPLPCKGIGLFGHIENKIALPLTEGEDLYDESNQTETVLCGVRRENG